MLRTSRCQNGFVGVVPVGFKQAYEASGNLYNGKIIFAYTFLGNATGEEVVEAMLYSSHVICGCEWSEASENHK